MRILLLWFMVGMAVLKANAQSTTSTGVSNPSSASSTVNTNKKNTNTFEKTLTLPGAALPRLLWLSADEKVYSDSNLRAHTPLILVLFNPTCGHCMEVAVAMKTRIQEMAGVEIVFLAGSNLLPELPQFIQQTRMTGMPNVYIGIDQSDVTKQLFEYNGIPQIMVYNQSHVLLKTYYKQMNLDEIIRLIQSE